MAVLDNGGLTSIFRIFARDGLLKAFLTVATSVLSLVVTFLFLLASLSARTIVRPLFFVFFAFFVGVEFSVHRAFGAFSTPHLAEVAFWAADWRIIRDAGEMYFNFASLVPITIFGFVLVLTRPRDVYSRRASAMLLIASTLLFPATTYFSSNTYPTVSLSAGIRTLYSFPTIWVVGTRRLDPKNSYYFADREQVDLGTPNAANNNVVLIIDESVRGDYLSINGHPVRTTPTLERILGAGEMRNWGISASGTTCSVTSNNLMLTGLTKLPDISFEVFRRPTVFQFAYAMNYKTFLIDAQASSVWLGKPADFSYVDEWVRVFDLIEPTAEMFEADAAAAAKIDQIVRSSTGNFIWVNKFGVHRPYSASHPDSSGVPASDQERLLNSSATPRAVVQAAYEKSIAYNSESFFATLFSAGPAPATYYVYTSDHGQAFGEGYAAASHCVPVVEAANVPLLLIAERELLPAADTDYRATHGNIFPTLLDLFGVPDDKRTAGYGLSLLRARREDSVRRHFFSGDLHLDEGLHPFDP
jgi:glucan phosphoethanolaminetransferase (alkaline phosphatase superfamily)